MLEALMSCHFRTCELERLIGTIAIKWRWRDFKYMAAGSRQEGVGRGEETFDMTEESDMDDIRLSDRALSKFL